MRIEPEELDLESIRALVPALPIAILAEAVAGEGVFVFDMGPWSGDVRFRCPVCRYRDHNAPSARVIDDARWSCDRCGIRRSRWALERLVTEDIDHLERLAVLVAATEAA